MIGALDRALPAAALLLALVGAPSSARARAPEVSMRLVPAPAPGACSAAARACFAEAALAIRNRSARALLVESIEIVGPVRGQVEPLDPPVRIAPGAEYLSTARFEVHVEATHRLHIRLRDARGGTRAVDVTFGPERALREAAAARCARCASDGGADACQCATGDAGRRCSDGAECQGACLFERFDEKAPTCREQPGGPRCPIPVRTGVRTGRCSEWRVPVGCVSVIPHHDPPGRLETLPAPNDVECFK